MTHSNSQQETITRFAWLSIFAALVTIGLKSGAYWLTGSVSLLSDALESVVNLVTAVAALAALLIAAKAPDDEHAYGHSKAEYFSSGFEGLLVLIAAFGIAFTAIPRLFNPVSLEHVGAGLAVSVVASVVNGAVAWRLFRAADTYRSITLHASAKHLMTDVWTSVGVLLGVALVGLTNWDRLDPLLAIAVAVNIVWTGWRLVRQAMLGLLDTALPGTDIDTIESVLARYREQDKIETHALRTRQAGSRRFMSVHILVPGHWTVQRGHRLLETIEHDIHAALPDTTVFTHLESLDDPASWDDMTLDRGSGRRLHGNGKGPHLLK
jgi:cation diffusion facilitator family transporter